MNETDSQDLAQSVYSAASGDILLSASPVHKLAKRHQEQPASAGGGVDRLSPLTRREREIFLLVVKGLSNRSIQERLCIGPDAVKTHVKNIFDKLGVHGRVQLVIWAYNNQVIEPEAEQG